MQVIPAIEVEAGRSRVVAWPSGGATGAPTDRPEVIAERFARLGAPLVHVVDLDGARAGAPANLEAIGRIAARIATPLQLAGGLERADHVRLAFAAGATRVVLSLAVADDPPTLRECLAVAGDWLAIGLDPRPERLEAFPWHRPHPPTLDELAAELASAGVARFVLSHGGAEPDVEGLRRLADRSGVEVLVAGGVTDTAGLARLRDAGVAGVILGETLLSGRIDYPSALEAAA